MYAAEGNPLFLEQLVAMRADDPAVRTPPTIQALLAARIDALPLRERRVIEAASIEGRGFHRGAVRALVDQKRSVDAALAALVDRELIRPDRSEIPGETGYRFTHILVRDAAYDLLPKRRRADLHVAYADWLFGREDPGSAADEIVGYHLEQAYEYRSQLGRAGDDRHRELAARASGHLSDAGRRALAAGDRGGASNLLERAVALRTKTDPDERGSSSTSAASTASGAASRRPRRRCARRGRWRSMRRTGRSRPGRRSPASLSRLQVDPDAVARLMRRQAAGLERALEAAGDHAGLAQLWHVRALLWWIKCQSGRGGAGLAAGRRRGVAGGRRADALRRRRVGGVIHGRSGRRRSTTAIVRCREIRAILKNDPWAEALALQPLASLHAMRGEFATAFALLDESSATLAGFGPTVDAAVSHPEVFVADSGGRSRSCRAAPPGRPAPPGADGRAGGARLDRGLPGAGCCSWPDAIARRTGSRGGVPRSRPTTMPRRRSFGARCGRACSHGAVRRGGRSSSPARRSRSR